MFAKPQSVSLEWDEFMRHNVNRPSHPLGFWHWLTGVLLVAILVVLCLADSFTLRRNLHSTLPYNDLPRDGRQAVLHSACFALAMAATAFVFDWKEPANEPASRTRGHRVSFVGNVAWNRRLSERRGRAELHGCSDLFGACPRILSRDEPRDVFQMAGARHATFPPACASVQLEAGSRYAMEVGWSAGFSGFNRHDHIPISLSPE